MAAPFIVTSRLSNILEMITLSRQTGILRVIRGHGATREIGQIRFDGGRPVSALLGQLTGETALNTLQNWGECHYAFDENMAADASAGQGYGQPSQGSYPGQSGYSSQPSSGSWPTYGYQSQGGSNPAYSAPSLPDLYPGWMPQGQPTPPNPYQGAPLSPDAPYGPAYGQQGMTRPVTTSSLPRVSPDLLAIVPRRTPVSEQVDQLPLDRRERMVLLLVDGQRAISDLARLTRRNEQDLLSVLTHLEMLGLVIFRRNTLGG